MTRNATLLILLFFAFGCVNSLKILDRGNPERAYKTSKRQIDRRLSKGKIVDDVERIALQESYVQLQRKLISRVEVLEQKGDADRWLSLYSIYSQLLSRRQDVDKYLELLPQLQPFYDTDVLAALTERSRINAGDYCFEQAEIQFTEARAGLKSAARRGYHWMLKSMTYVPENTTFKEHLAEMHELSIVRVELLAAESYDFYHQQAIHSVFDYRGGVFRDNWLEVHFTPVNKRIDYQATMVVESVYVSSDQESASTRRYSREIIERYETVEKEVSQGDSTVTVIEQVPVKITVCGEITEVDQSKNSSGRLLLILEPVAAKGYGTDWRINSGADWSNSFSICSGDSRALPCSCSGFDSGFPSDAHMVSCLAGSFRSRILNHLSQYFPEKKEGSRKHRRWQLFAG